VKNINRPYYKKAPIRSMDALSKALGLEVTVLVDLANTASHRYRLAKAEVKADGTIRQTYDALDLLKEVHDRIKNNIFLRVHFPDYLTGSLKGKDYVTNARLHTGAKIIISEDVEAFFPSTSDNLVFKIWKSFFGFSDDVAQILTKLTTKDGQLPQGAKTSSYLANLAFWDSEYKLYKILVEKKIVYSRFVDDIAISSKTYLTNEDKTIIIAKVYGMLKRHGYKAKRRKHEIATSGSRMAITKLTVNSRNPSLSKKEKASIRAVVNQLENKATLTKTDINKATGLVGKLSRLHPAEGQKLLSRVRLVRKINNSIFA
jgi:Reverse transcriptase (RNA-dependent DNA polymerase)